MPSRKTSKPVPTPEKGDAPCDAGPAVTSVAFKIAGLPTELLVRIFDYVTEVQFGGPTMMVVDSSKELADVDVRPLINLTHVCSRWRKIALNSHVCCGRDFP